MGISKREFLVTGGAIVIAGVTSGLIAKPTFAKELAYLPRTKLDVELVRKLAWKHFHHSGGGCMNGAASGLIEATKIAFGPGTNWDYIPHGKNSFYKYGAAGINGWGTVCGVPNGCCAYLNLINLHNELADEVLGFYSTTRFPTDLVCKAYDGSWATPIPMADNKVLAHTVAGSPICHVSISKWCYAAGVNLADKDEESRGYKQDRCGKMCADVAARTAELINGAARTFVKDEKIKHCMSCHNKKSDTMEAPAQLGEVGCVGCHTDKEKEH